MRLKSGVKLAGLQPQMVMALLVIEPIFKAAGQELVVTCGANGTHSSRNSKHHLGCALDLRTWDIVDKNAVEAQVRDALGDEYYAQMETSHLHVQYNGSVM